GRVAATGSPAELAAGLDAEQRISFRPSAPIDRSLLAGLPGVTSVIWRGSTVQVTGTGDVLSSVTSALAARRIVAGQLRVEQASLEDAFVALTGHAQTDNSKGETTNV